MSPLSVVHGDGPGDAWIKATHLLLDAKKHRITNLVVDIERPLEPASDLAKELDTALSAKPGNRVRDVARTIMPRTVATAPDWRAAAKTLAVKWPRRTYFSRMVRFDDAGTNQIVGVIDALRRGGVDPHPIVFVRPGDEAPANRGFPCLSEVQFHHDREARRLNATATYRSQYFDSKALGNYLGLGLLLRLVACEAAITPGGLTVLATDARIGGSVQALRQLLNGTR